MVSYRVEPRLLGRAERRMAAKLRSKRIMRVLTAAGRDIVQMLRTRSRSVYDLGGYSSGWYYTPGRDVLTISNRAPNFIFVEKGRRPGRRQPPLRPIRAWCLRHGMRANAAFPVARAIGRHGIAARPLFLLDAVQDEMEKLVNKRLNRWLDRVVRSR